MLPEVLTVRLLVLGVVVLLAFVLILPTVRGAVQQQAQIDRLQAELDAHETERAALQDELDRWDDRSYVIQQARSRLNYVVPGDTVWRVVDADAIEGDDAADAGQSDAPTVAAAPTGAPWYEGLWESVQVTDRAAAPEDLPSPAVSPSAPADGDERDGAGDASPAPDGGE
ncbi:cell division protein FtsB [Isoptericola jiangsuensis]|uniref:Cell division protein FtsB n=1 Tax=Isoptericola jiangsuensis TaxID=548579 RepID=A0A2A9EZL8_9MICO|nr:cell division protein FtsB [Isoptericola jiangsuensis]